MDNGGAAEKVERMLQDHETRIKRLETVYPGIQEITDIVTSIKKYVKIWGPIVATAAISSGIVSGKWGAFFRALLQ
jgi:hypothetical protein